MRSLVRTRQNHAQRLPVPVPRTRPIRIGTVTSFPQEVPFDLTEDALAVHMAVLGGSGSGKSKLLELMLRRTMIAGDRGFCLIDPHGDTAEDLLAYAAHRFAEKDAAILDRIHYIAPGKGILPRYDPFKRPALHLPRWHPDDIEEAWLQAKVDHLSEILQTNQGQTGFEGMPRLQRVLRNTLYGCGKTVAGRHLPLADALVFLNVYHPKHLDVYRTLEAHLDSDTRADFAVLHDFKRADDVRRETESTVNRLRTFLSGVIPAMFTSDGTQPSIDWHEIVQSNGILLVNLRKTEFFSLEQKNAIGKLIIHELLTAIANTPRRQRCPFQLVVDEAGEFLCEDLKQALGAVRKYRLSITLAGQDLSTFQSEKLDLRAKILSQCGTVICFQQQCEEDLEILQPRVGRGNYDFEKLLGESQFNAGYDIEEWEDTGESFMTGENWGENESQGLSLSRTEAESASESQNQNWSAGHSRNDAASETLQFHPTLGLMLTKGIGVGGGRSDSQGGGTGTTQGTSSADSLAQTVNRGVSRGGSSGKTMSRTRKKVMIPKFIKLKQDTGRLVDAIADQAERQKTIIYNLEPGEAVVKCRRVPFAFLLQVDIVREFFSEDMKFDVLEWFEGLVFAHHAYNHVPRIKGAQERRLATFLGGDSAQGESGEDPAGNSQELRESGFGV